MASIINASVASSGIVSTADASGILKVQSNGTTTNALAWVKFNGITTVTVNASYNVSSVTRTTTGTYVINFTNALTDANYVPQFAYSSLSNSSSLTIYAQGASQYSAPNAQTTSSLGIYCTDYTNTLRDVGGVYVAIFGN
jgi:hypothetical protein